MGAFLGCCGSGGGSSTLAGLSDVTISNPITGQLLTWNGTKWANEAPATPANVPVLIGSSVASSPVASLTVSSIPGTYSALQIVIYGQATVASNEEMFLTFNGDTGSNYDLQLLQAFGATVQSISSVNQTSADVGTFSNSTATVPGGSNTLIPGYTSTTIGKTGIVTSALAGSTNFVQSRTIVWHPATPAAIASVTVTIQSGNISTGGFLAVYGLP